MAISLIKISKKPKRKKKKRKQVILPPLIKELFFTFVASIVVLVFMHVCISTIL
jgi:hypothetical protein